MQKTTCAACGIEFSVPDDFMAKLRQTGQGFYCPNGHSLVFKPSEVEKLKEKISILEQRLSWANEETEYWRGVVDGLRGEVVLYQRKYSGYKGQFVRLKNSLLSNTACTPTGGDSPALSVPSSPENIPANQGEPTQPAVG